MRALSVEISLKKDKTWPLSDTFLHINLFRTADGGYFLLPLPSVFLFSYKNMITMLRGY